MDLAKRARSGDAGRWALDQHDHGGVDNDDGGAAGAAAMAPARRKAVSGCGGGADADAALFERVLLGRVSLQEACDRGLQLTDARRQLLSRVRGGHG